MIILRATWTQKRNHYRGSDEDNLYHHLRLHRYRRKYCHHRDPNRGGGRHQCPGHHPRVGSDTNRAIWTHEAGSDYTDLGGRHQCPGHPLLGDDYTDLERTWSDAVMAMDAGVGEVDDQVPGTYTLTFDYTDSNGNAAATVTSTVIVEDSSAPIVTLIGDTNVTHEAYYISVPSGMTRSTATDLTGVGVVDDQVPGTYTPPLITLTVTATATTPEPW